MSSSETRVTFEISPGGPSRRFAPQHRGTRPVRSIMRRPGKNVGDTLSSGDISNIWHHSYHRPSSVWRASSPHTHYVGSRKLGHSSVFSFSSNTTRSPSRHKRHSSHSSAGGSTSSRNHRRSTSASGTTSSHKGHTSHKRPHSNLENAFKTVFTSGSRKHSSGAVSNPRKLGHGKESSVDSSFIYVASPPREIDTSSSRHPGHGRSASGGSAYQGFPAQNSLSPFDLRSLESALPSTPYYVPNFGTPSPPHNSYTDSFRPPNLHYSNPWTRSSSHFTPPPAERVHVHTELLASGQTLRWDMMLPPQTAISGFDDSSLYTMIYSGLPAVDSTSQDFLEDPACPGAAHIIVRAGDSTLALWMDQWGPIEIYPSSPASAMHSEITVFEVLRALYMYFQVRLTSKATIELPVESRQRVAHARATRVVSEGQAAHKAEWDLPPKRVDVLALWSMFGGFEVKYNGYGHLDEPGWRVVELELKLQNA